MKDQLKYIFLVAICFLALQISAQTASQNFVLSRTFKQTGAPVYDVSKVNIQVQYLDGLGRPSQTVSVGQSTTGSDIISPVEYDAYGRQPKSYLPYAGGGSGAYQGSAISNQASFYSGNTPQLESSDLGRPYAETTFDASPASRPVGMRAPGNKSTSGSVIYTANDGSEVKRYNYTANSDITLTISQNGTFAAGKLYKTQTTDENGKINVEFTDTKGRIICKKEGSETLTTYYVYDDFGLLRGVLQPEYQDNGSAADFAFLYDYDERGRVITKKVPGAGKMDIVYDNFDRQVMSQDANQSSRGVWGFSKYDAISRLAMTGEYTSGSSRGTLQAAFNASAAHHEDKSGSGVGYSLTNTLPNISESDLLNVTNYDDYSFPGNQAYVNVLSVSANSAVKSQQTGGRTRMLTSGSAWLVSTTHYDAEYRSIQNIRQLYDLGPISTERVSTKYKYDLAAVVDQEKTDHESSGTVTNSHLKTFSYDHADRLLSVKEKLTLGSTTKEATTVAHRYNILGQLQSKWLHSDDASKFRRRTDYVNNIRGWITDGKTVYKQIDNGPDLPFFRFGLTYANGSNYTNGNISQMLWNRKDETNLTKGLSFSYDGVNRLTASSGVSGYADTESGITYYKNGNIQTLSRAGANVDNLTYSYTGNRLSSVSDASANNSGVKSGSSSYGCDANGNMTFDGNRGAVLTYNYLNLPKTVAISGKTLIYDYDASGVKHKYVADTLTVKYASGFEYNATNVVTRLSLADGQALLKNNVILFQYYVRDHLGNVRVVFNEKGDILQKNDFYAFGSEINRDGTTDKNSKGINRYLFQGQEFQTYTGYTQFKWRSYDPLIGRFLSIDPLSEKFQSNSTYAFSENKVTIHIELEGLESVPVNPAGVAFGKAENAWNGVVQKVNGITNSANAYLNSVGRAVSDGLAPVDGIRLTSSSGKALERRRSNYPSRESVNIDGILAAAGAATGDPSKVGLVGKSILNKVISTVEMLKEALGFSGNIGDAVEAAKPLLSPGDDKSKEKKDEKMDKLSQEDIINKQMDNVPGMQSGSTSVNSDSSEAIFRYYNENKKLFRIDTLRPQEKK